MATLKTQFSLRLDPIIYAKLKIISKVENRSVSNMIDFIIKQTIKKYENEKGIIHLTEDDIYSL